MGALMAQKATKGIFITTSSFTNDAKNYILEVGIKIILIDGEELAKLLVENDIGVSVVSQYPVKKIDPDYFTESP